MQKKMIKVVLLTSVFCFNSVTSAADVALTSVNTKHASATNSGLKIGVIDSQVIMTSDVTKAAQLELGNLQSELENELKVLDVDLEKRYKAIQAKSKLADASVLEKEQEAFKEAKDKRDLAAKTAGEKMQRAGNKAMEQLGKLVQDASNVLLQDLGLDLILDKGATLAYSKKIDVTDKLIAKIKFMQGSDASKNNDSTSAKPAAKK